MDRLDIVLPVRPGDDNPELRYTLRGIDENFPHRHIWIVGHKPKWVRADAVGFIPGNTASRRANLWHNLLAACRTPQVSEEVVIFNDDFFITKPVEQMPILYRGTLRDHLAMRRVQSGPPWWRQSLETTLVMLQTLGYDEPISYELHVPFRVDKHAMRQVLERFKTITPDNPPQWRSLYGNLCDIGGQPSPDCKAYKAGPLSEPWHSTDDFSIRYFLDQLEQRFPEPSRYEVESR